MTSLAALERQTRTSTLDPPPMTTRIGVMKALVADDHPLVRDALALTVRRAVADCKVFEAPDFVAALSMCKDLSPDFALLDLRMPGMNGVEGVGNLHRQFPEIALVVASAQEDAASIRAALAAGASGFYPKSAPSETLVQALRLVLAGGVYVPVGALADFHDGNPPVKPDLAGLTPRQLDVVGYLSRGLSNKLIARELGLAEGTVKMHIAAILRVLDARNRTEAVIRAGKLGLDKSAS